MWYDALTETGDGVFIDVRVSPGSGNSRLRGYDQWRKCILVDIKSEPRQGKANSELVSLLGNLLDLPSSDIRISSGQASHQKRIFVQGVTAGKVKARLGEVLEPV